MQPELQQKQQQQEQPLQAEIEAPRHHDIKQDGEQQALNQPQFASNAAQHSEQQQAPAWQNYSSVFTAAKAGMGGVDQQKVKQVVYEMSKVRLHTDSCAVVACTSPVMACSSQQLCAVGDRVFAGALCPSRCSVLMLPAWLLHAELSALCK